MARTTHSEVKQLINTNLSNDAIDVWIDSANCIVNEKEDCINGTETLLDKIELQLTCHFLAMLNPAAGGIKTGEKMKDFSVSYAVGPGVEDDINQTVYGKTANMLSGGCLSNTTDAKVSFASIGGECCE